MEKLYEIYLITNSKNNKKYVGQVIKYRGYKQRFAEHLSAAYYDGNLTKFHSAIKHYGPEAFSVELIETDIPESEIDSKEIYYIKEYNTFYLDGQGYNMTQGGQGVHGFEYTDEIRSRMSEGSKRMWKNLYEDQDRLSARNMKISEALKGVHKSEVARKNSSIAAKKRFENSPGTFTGKCHSEESKRKIAEKNGHAVGMYDKDTGELLHTFLSCTEASRYLVDAGLTKNHAAYTRIITICEGVKGQGKTAYGYVWKYLQQKCNDYPEKE